MINRLPALVLALLAVSILPLHAGTALEGKMKSMKDSYRALKTAMDAPVDADKAKYLALATKLKDSAVAARDLKPQKLSEIPADQQAAFLDSYKKEMDKLIKLVDELSQAISAGNWDSAKKNLASINETRREGHKEFMSEKE